MQIIGVQQITEIPEYPPCVKGIVNLREQVISAIDIRIRLGKKELAYNASLDSLSCKQRRVRVILA